MNLKHWDLQSLFLCKKITDTLYLTLNVYIIFNYFFEDNSQNVKNRFRQGMILVYNVYETAPYTCIAFNFFGKEIFDGLFYYRVLLQRMLRLQY